MATIEISQDDIKDMLEDAARQGYTHCRWKSVIGGMEGKLSGYCLQVRTGIDSETGHDLWENFVPSSGNQ